MCLPAAPRSLPSQGALPGPSLIAAGLVVLILAVWWPGAPVVSGMALVALGATGALVRSLRGSAMLAGVVAVHVFVYVSLYLIFVGAVCHAAFGGAAGRLTFLQGLDFGVSAGLMAQAVRWSLAAMGGGGVKG